MISLYFRTNAVDVNVCEASFPVSTERFMCEQAASLTTTWPKSFLLHLPQRMVGNVLLARGVATFGLFGFFLARETSQKRSKKTRLSQKCPINVL